MSNIKVIELGEYTENPVRVNILRKGDVLVVPRAASQPVLRLQIIEVEGELRLLNLVSLNVIPRHYGNFCKWTKGGMQGTIPKDKARQLLGDFFDTAELVV